MHGAAVSRDRVARGVAGGHGERDRRAGGGAVGDPPAMVRPLIATTRLGLGDQIWPTTKTRSLLLPLTVRIVGPGPLMVSARVMASAPPVSVMVCGPDGRPNWMVSLLP